MILILSPLYYTIRLVSLYTKFCLIDKMILKLYAFVDYIRSSYDHLLIISLYDVCKHIVISLLQTELSELRASMKV